ATSSSAAAIAVRRPLAIPPRATASLSAYTANTRPTTRAKPQPRSSRREKTTQQIGNAAAPAAAIARYQRSAAAKDPVSASAGGGGAVRTAFPRGGSTGAETVRFPRGSFSHSQIVVGVDVPSAASRRALARAFEYRADLRKSRTRGWSYTVNCSSAESSG